MSRRHTFLGVTMAILLPFLTAAAPSAAADGGKPVEVRGGLVNTINAIDLVESDVPGGYFKLQGSTTWTGSWTGITHYKLQGTFDLETGDGQGTITETFYGLDPDGRYGILELAGTFISDGGLHERRSVLFPHRAPHCERNRRLRGL